MGRDEDSTAIGGKKADTAGVASTTSCVPNYWPYGRLYTDSSLGVAPASPQAPPSSFDRQRIGNAISVEGVGSPGNVEEIDCRFEEERCGSERRVRDMVEEMRSLRYKGEDDKGHHEDGSIIDLRGDVFIKGVKGVEEGVAPIDPS